MRHERVRVGVNGVGTFGWSLAAAVGRQPDMELVGIRDVSAQGAAGRASRRGFAIYAAPAATGYPAAPPVPMYSRFSDPLGRRDGVADCAPPGGAARILKRCRLAGVRAVVQAGEPHAVAGHSFLAEVNYASAVGRPATRVVSSDAAAALRTLTALQRAGLMDRASGTLIGRPGRHRKHEQHRAATPVARRAQDLASEVRAVVTDLNVTAVSVETAHARCHLQSWRVELARGATRDDVMEILSSTPRVAVVRMSEGVLAELMSDLGCAEGQSGDVAVWEDLLTVESDEAFYTCQVFDEAIVVCETVDAIRALARVVTDARESIRLTDVSLGARPPFRLSRAAEREARRRRRQFRLLNGPPWSDPQPHTRPVIA